MSKAAAKLIFVKLCDVKHCAISLLIEKYLKICILYKVVTTAPLFSKYSKITLISEGLMQLLATPGHAQCQITFHLVHPRDE